MGVVWSFINPLFMLIIYTFVFSMVFKARWSVTSDSKTEFALILFSGLIVFNFFSECIGKAPSLILSNINYVKKVVFPLEVLPIVTVGSALVHAAINLFVWLIAYVIFIGTPPATIFLLPVIILPLMLITLGLSWFLASLGVYVRDVSQFIGMIVTVLMFLSPIFYPISSIPVEYQIFLKFNPLTPVLEQVRGVLFWGLIPDLGEWLMYFFSSLLVAWIGFSWFQKTRRGFADVL